MPAPDERLSNFLAALPVILLSTLFNVFIASVMGIMVFLQLQLVAEWPRSSSEAAALLMAVVTYLYIWWQPKIRNYISTRSQ